MEDDENIPRDDDIPDDEDMPPINPWIIFQAPHLQPL